MRKKDLLKEVAINAYNVGFGAKKHFASYDIIIKLPYWISFIVLSVGILQLSYENFQFQKEVSILLILVSIASLFLNFYNSSKEDFRVKGVELTKLFNELRMLYYRIEGSEKGNLEIAEKEMHQILNCFYETSITKQVFLSQWYAHFKFFYEMQIEWLDAELKFKFWKDKIPNSFKILLFFILLIILIMAVITYLYE